MESISVYSQNGTCLWSGQGVAEFLGDMLTVKTSRGTLRFYGIKSLIVQVEGQITGVSERRMQK